MRGLNLRGIDAAEHPPASAVVASGGAFVGFYLDGPFAPSLLTVASYLNAHLALVSIWELQADAALGGALRGSKDGAKAVARARAYRQPKDSAIYATVDFDPSASQLQLVKQYVEAFARETRGSGYRCGLYGGTNTLQACASLVDHTWQAAGWSHGVAWPADLRQLLTQTTVGQVQVDDDVALRVPFGAWDLHGPWPAPTSPLEALTATLGTTSPAPFWQAIWPDHPADAVDWCAIAVSWAFEHAGEPLPKMDETKVTSGFAFCPDAQAWAKAHGWWTDAPKKGDVVLYCWDRSGTPQHTGIVESVGKDTVTSIEGNTGDPPAVRRQTRARSLAVGFLSPFATRPSEDEPMWIDTYNRATILVCPAQGGYYLLGAEAIAYYRANGVPTASKAIVEGVASRLKRLGTI